MKDVVTRFLENVESRPGKPAVIVDNESVSYGQLGNLVKQIGSAVSAAGLHPRVLIYLDKGYEAYAAIFGTLMAGGYYCPINMDAPAYRHHEIIEQFRPDIILTSNNWVSDLHIDRLHTKVIDITNLPVEFLNHPLDAHDLAYTMFTSGSTGKPKGVMISRAGLSHYAEWAIDAMEVTCEDRWSQHPNIAFDLSVLDIFGALCGGATLYPVVSQKDKLLTASFIKNHQLTIWNSVPSVIDLMMRAHQVTQDNFSSLRLITFCGEALLRRHLDPIFDAKESVIVHNTYGPTEATVSCTLIKLTSENYLDSCEYGVALGQPIKGMDIVLLDGPDQESGEIVLLGPQLARGYWKNEAATKKSFMWLKMGDKSALAYRTGDWAVRQNKQLYFKQRIDSQIKVRGNRVELGEIDAVFSDMGYGNTCSILVDGKLHTVLETGSSLDKAKIIRDIAERLPDYEVPSELHALSKLPRNQNDKIDRKELSKIINQKVRANN